MSLFFDFGLFMLGASILSFANVVSLRLPKRLNFITSRSCCPFCHHVLHFYDLIPVFSWLLLKGRCRYCHKKISIRYFLIEILGGILLVHCFHHYGIQIEMFLSFLLMVILIIIALIDYQIMLIPDSLIILIFVLDIIYLFFCHQMKTHLIGFFIISIPIYLLNICYKESFGGGDIKLFAVCGLFLGWQSIFIATLIAVFSASLFALFMMMFRRVKVNQYIAFGPFIALGVIIALLYGSQMMNIYLNLFF